MPLRFERPIKLGNVLDDRLHERSGGAALSDVVVALIRDSGNPATVYRCKVPTGGELTILSEHPVDGAPNRDWESLALGYAPNKSPALFIAEHNCTLWRVAVPGADTGALVGGRIAHTLPKSYNVEATGVNRMTNEFFAVPRGPEASTTRPLLYAPDVNTPTLLREIATLEGFTAGQTVTDCTIARGGRWFGLLQHGRVHLWNVPDPGAMPRTLRGAAHYVIDGPLDGGSMGETLISLPNGNWLTTDEKVPGSVYLIERRSGP